MGKVNRPPSKYRATRRPMPDFREHFEEVSKRVSAKSEQRENGCIEWVDYKNQLGYGYLYWDGKYWMAHRVVYCLHHGPFDPWLDVRHSCDNPGCVNVDHLSIGTRMDNMRDAVDRRRSKNAKKTHCPKGHAYDEHGTEFTPNTVHYKKWRRCKICQLAAVRMGRLGWPEDLAYSLPPKRGQKVGSPARRYDNGS